MRSVRLALVFAVVNVAAPAAGPLNVLRVHPADEAQPRTEITVTFDRPVAAGLDATVDATRIFRIDPAVSGRIEWRDPVTLRFVPARPLSPGASYRVTIANTFAAMDGSRLAQPYSFVVRVSPPAVLEGSPVGSFQPALFVNARPVLQLLLDAPADPQLLASASAITMDRRCGGRIGLTALRIRPVSDDDPPHLRYRGQSYYGRQRDTLRDLRRIVELTPQSPLPLACTGTLTVPQRVEPGASARLSWNFETYRPLAVAGAGCAVENFCPTGPVRLHFSTPVRGSEVLRHVRIVPNLTYTLHDTAGESSEWILEARLQPRQHYAVIVDSLITDVFGQRMRPMAVKPFLTTSYAPTVSYPFGKLLVERQGLRTLPVELVNVDTLLVTTIPVPESAEASFLSQSWRWAEPFEDLQSRAVQRKIAQTPRLDQPFLAGVPLPAHDARRSADGTLLAARITRRGATAPGEEPAIALLQVTDLGVHGRVGMDEGMVWVTGVRDGRPRAGALVTLYDTRGKVRTTARTDAQGLARLTDFSAPSDTSVCSEWCAGFDGYLAATLNDDRAVVGLNSYDPDLAPWRFGVRPAWSTKQRMPAAAAVFTERGIYRPGERVIAKAIVRQGPLGTLTVPRSDSLKWVFTDRESGVLSDTVTLLSAFGTADQSLVLAQDLPLGDYQVQLSLKRAGSWRPLASTFYQVAEYRPPEFLVDVTADAAPRMGGDTLKSNVTARYLFGAPMARAQVRWTVQQRSLNPWELRIPNTDGWQIGGYDDDYEEPGIQVAREGLDTLDARGSLDLSIVLPAPVQGRAARTSLLAVVSDANRQTVSAGHSVLVHPAAIYIGSRVRGSSYFLRAGEPVTVDLIAVRPAGERVSGVAVQGVVIRREWHTVRRNRNGDIQEVGGWVSDTVSTCRVQTTSEPVSCNFTPATGGQYAFVFSARDVQGRGARTTLWRWAAGPGWVPWRDDNQLKIEVIPDRQRYSVGDTATLLIASPFTDVEAWFTVERERVLESRRIRLTAGATTLKVPITEALAPNAFVSILLVRGRSAQPGPPDDPGRPALRVGYAELRVLPEVKELDVQVAPLQPEYRPGDTARVRVAVKDAAGRGQRAEVTLWAVDEGVLALTGYQTPNPLELIYQPRPLGVRLASNLVSVAAQVPPGLKGRRESGGGGGADASGVLRSRFQTTAFFIGSLVTDAAGNATGSAKLPDNLTTFRLMAVAVTAGDRYGSGSSSMLVTRPLLARPSLPRFLREGDRFAAGVVVNQRAAGVRRVEVDATARGIELRGARRKTETLDGAAGREVRFDFTAQAGDSAHFQFGVRSGNDADAVALRVPVKPSYHPLAQTIAGALHDTASAVFTLEQNVDPSRSRLEISFGSSTLSILRGARRTLRVYPYYCTEQVSSAALPLIALYRAQRELGSAPVAGAHAEEDIRTAVRTIIRRQRPDGGIGYWSPNDWTTPWLTAYATRVLLEARAAGVPVDSTVLNKVRDYLSRSLREREIPRFAVAHWYENAAPLARSERVAAVDVLSRLGRADVPMENTLFGQAAQLAWEDRVLLAEVLARRGALSPARNLLAAAWQSVHVEGRKLSLPARTTGHYFESSVRPAARLLSATLAIEPAHPRIGPLVETLVAQGRALSASWNTQDYGAVVLALLPYERLRRQSPQPTVQIRGSNGLLLTRDLRVAESRDTSVALSGLVRGQTVRLDLAVRNGSAPVYYYITVREVPRTRPVRPVDRGIQVERWYERLDTRQPITSVVAGQLVRVKLRITVPDERHFVIVDDPLPAGLEAVDLSLRTVSPLGARDLLQARDTEQERDEPNWYFGTWDSGLWSVFDYKELRDDRVLYFATMLWKGTYTATYLARATTMGTFVSPPAHAEEMYNPGVNGRTGGATFTVTAR